MNMQRFVLLLLRQYGKWEAYKTLYEDVGLANKAGEKLCGNKEWVDYRVSIVYI